MKIPYRDTWTHVEGQTEREYRILPRVSDGGPWRGPSTEEWVERIARGSTPVREYVDGEFRAWIRASDTERQP